MPIPPHPRRAEAESLLREGLSVTEVAGRIEASVTVVRLWRRRLGLSRGRAGRPAGGDLSPLAQEAIWRLGRGDLPAQIARDLGVSAARIRQIRASLSDGEEK